MKVKTAHTYKPLQDLGRSFFKISSSNQVQRFSLLQARAWQRPEFFFAISPATWFYGQSEPFIMPIIPKIQKKVIFNLEPRGENGKLGLDLTSLVLNLELMANGASWAGLSIACSDSETLPVGWHCPEQQHPQNPSSSGFPKNQFQESLWSLPFF